MVTIAIKDLPESIDLDRQAMLAIAGGTRFGGRWNFLGRTVLRNERIIDYPGRFLAYSVAGAVGRMADRKPVK